MHSTYDLDDGYVGSGLILKRSIAKYSLDLHEVEILSFFSSRKEAADHEQELIRDKIQDSNCMNIKPGGEGGWTSDEQKENNKKSQKAQARLFAEDPEWVKTRSDNISKGLKEAYANGTKKAYHYDWTGRKHSEESKAKMREAAQGRGVGTTNNMYGTKWIYSDELQQSKRILKDDPIPEGWKKGRKMSWD